MDRLNDDCLLLIFRLLEINDQISVALACQRSRALLSEIWMKKYTNCTCWGFYDLTEEQLSMLIKFICIIVESMKFKALKLKQFQVMKLFRYPSVVSFEFYDTKELDDSHLFEMTKMFPNLQSFKPSGPFSGLHIQNWQQLKHLDLSLCSDIDFACLEKIFEALNLETFVLGVFRDCPSWTSECAFEKFCQLESITINIVELKWLDDLPKFINLKHLAVDGVCIDDENNEYDKSFETFEHFKNLWTNLYECKRNELIELDAPEYFILPYLQSPSVKFENLRRLVAKHLEMCDVANIYSIAPNLKELIFFNVFIGELKDLFMFTVHPQLELLSAEFGACTFNEINVNAEEILQNRSKEFRLNIRDITNLETSKDVVVNIHGNNSLLKCTTGHHCNYELFYFQVKFQ